MCVYNYIVIYISFVYLLFVEFLKYIPLVIKFIYIYIYIYIIVNSKCNKCIKNTSSHDKTRFYLKRGSDILESKKFRHALESGLFPLSQHPINTYRVRAVPLVLDPQLLPR